MTFTEAMKVAVLINSVNFVSPVKYRVSEIQRTEAVITFRLVRSISHISRAVIYVDVYG
jgi:hypothetical protein